MTLSGTKLGFKYNPGLLYFKLKRQPLREGEEGARGISLFSVGNTRYQLSKKGKCGNNLAFTLYKRQPKNG